MTEEDDDKFFPIKKTREAKAAVYDDEGLPQPEKPFLSQDLDVGVRLAIRPTN